LANNYQPGGRVDRYLPSYPANNDPPGDRVGRANTLHPAVRLIVIARSCPARQCKSLLTPAATICRLSLTDYPGKSVIIIVAQYYIAFIAYLSLCADILI